MAQANDKDTDMLLAAGWRKIGTGGHKYGKLEYWDHPDHNDGTRGYIPRGEAIRIQRQIDREWASRKRDSDYKTRFA